MTEDIEVLRYPIGKFKGPAEYSSELVRQNIRTISELPKKLISEVGRLKEDQLETPYRQEGWTVLQTVHHIFDSHVNSYCRFKLALTEDNPTIKPYKEALWAELADSKNAPVEWSLQLIDLLHKRWVVLLQSMTDADWQKTFNHPEMGKDIPLYRFVALYDWHSRHHLAHIVNLKERMGW
jgi:uncharacterized damage-inducible protein DinB